MSQLSTGLQMNDSLTNNGTTMVSFNFALGEGKVNVNLCFLFCFEKSQ